MSRKIQYHSSSEALTKASETEIAKPHLYKVVILNDDFTPMDFVVEVLQIFFGMNYFNASATMLQVHHSGRAICGVYTREIAETRIVQVNDFARQHEHPLLCTMEII